MSEKEVKKREIKPPSMVDVLIPIVSLIILLGAAIIIYGDEATAGPTQVALYGVGNRRAEPNTPEAAMPAQA